MHLYGSAVRRMPRQHVVPLTQSAIIVMLVVFWALLRTDAVWVTSALYLFAQMLGILLISQFWTLANEVYDARQAKRLFGLIGGGACLGGALGNSITLVTGGAGGQPAAHHRGGPRGVRRDCVAGRPPSRRRLTPASSRRNTASGGARHSGCWHSPVNCACSPRWSAWR